MTKNLSSAQKTFLHHTKTGPYRTPFTGGRDAGRVAAAWHRTAKALEKRGLVTLSRSGDAWVATGTPAGAQALGSL